MDDDITKENWFRCLWRPAIAWQYLVVCLFDFLIAPILTGLQAFYTKIPYVPWDPITLKESAFYHIAMGAIVGVAAYTRGREKIRQWGIEGPRGWQGQPPGQSPPQQQDQNGPNQ